MRSILITLDKTPSCATAQALAIGLARRNGAMLKGVIATDISDLEAMEPAPIGGMERAYERMVLRRRRADERRQMAAQLPDAFENACAAEGQNCSVTRLGSAVEVGLLRLIETVDLVVTGRDAQFHFEASDGAAPLLDVIIARGARPVLVTGEGSIDGGPVLVAYDGSASAARSLQLAVLLGMFAGRAVQVVSIRRHAASARKTAMRAAAFLESHGIGAAIEPRELSAEPAELLMKHADKVRASLLIMGAFGNRGLREMLFGSCTRRMYDACSTPLFISR
ncbi:MAG: universal stress protein [Enhydrobacter sp.]|nr:MAG: universal stress protein [Enhydrobacter sp.]